MYPIVSSKLSRVKVTKMIDSNNICLIIYKEKFWVCLVLHMSLIYKKLNI